MRQTLFQFLITIAVALLAGGAPLRAETIEQLNEKFTAAFDDSRYTEAAGLARKWLKRVQQDTPDDHYAVANCHYWLAKSLWCLSRYSEAEMRLKECHRVGSINDAYSRSEVSEVKVLLGSLYIEVGRYDDATKLLDEAEATLIELKQQGEDVTEHFALLTLNRTHLLLAKGRFVEAEKNAFEYRAAARQQEDWTELDETEVDLLLSNVYLLQNRIDEAVPFAERCYNVRRRELRAGHADLLVATNLLAYLRFAQEDYAAAERLYMTMLDGYLKLWGEQHYNSLNGRYYLGWLYQTTGRFYEAEQMYRRSLASATVIFGVDHPELSWLYNALGEVLLAYESYDELGKIAQTADEVGRGDRTTPQQRFRTKALLASVAWHRGDRKQAIELMTEAFDFAELQRLQIGGAEIGRARHFTEYAGAFEQMVEWAGELKDAELAFSTIERSRARTLLDQLRLAGSDLLAGVDAAAAEPLREKEQSAANEVSRIEQHLRDLASDATLTDADREQQKATALAELQTARQNYFDAYTEVREASPVYKLATSEALKPMSLEAVKVWCHQHQALLLEYNFGARGGYVFIAGPEIEPNLVKLEVGENQAAALGIAAGTLTEGQLAAALMTDAETGVLQKLRAAKRPADAKSLGPALKALWETLVPEAQRNAILAGKYKRLHVIPSGSLSLLPLETFVTGQTDEKITYLLDVGPPIVYGPSATVLANLAERGAGKKNSAKAVLSVGDPAYPKQAATNAAQEEAARGSATLGQRYSTRGGELSRLPFTDWEVQWVSDLLSKGGWAVQRLLRENSTEANFRRLAPGKGVIHVACHGLVDQTHGNLFGALALTPANSASATDDGFLTLAEINGLNLSGCNLAILSACETNIGPQQKGEGVWALSRGFLVAGSQRVVASNWLVDDEAGASLVSVLCSALAKQETAKQPSDYAEALQLARRYVRKQNKWQSPYYWGSFVLLGPE